MKKIILAIVIATSLYSCTKQNNTEYHSTKEPVMYYQFGSVTNTGDSILLITDKK